ncbi:MAG TPA: methyltransferase [Bacteroidales bacterium]|nr:methyltransferase [Bacteroidales bacterium]
MKITECPITASTDRVEYLNLGIVPLVNNLCKTRDESLACKKYPLAIQFFPESRLTSLTEVINKDNLFLNYLYRSGVNKPYLDHCARMYEYLSRQITFNNKDLVVDIGGNDGSLLIEFRKENRNLHYINIDCSKSFIETNQQTGIEYLNEYFCDNTQLEYKAKLITSTNVFQHTAPMRSFVQGVERNLAHDGVWCLEFPYILTTLADDNYDQVYHEHVYYYCLKNIVDLLDQEGMKVINVSYHDMHAGTLRVLSVKQSSQRQADSTILSFLNLERTLTEEYCLKWGRRTQEKIKDYKEFICDLVYKGKTIACFGAAAKGCVFLNSCGIDDSMIKFIVDDTPFKQGKFVPGTGIKVVSRESLKKHHIDYLLILAHNFKDYIIKSLKDEYSGKFIVMFPDIKIL